jgi:hypothetical protein
MIGHRRTLSLHVLVNCDRRKVTLASMQYPPKDLFALYQEFEHWNRARNLEPLCQNFLPWLLVYAEMFIVERDSVEVRKTVDTFAVPCLEKSHQLKSRRLGGK